VANRPAVCFAGSRVEALLAVRRYCDVVAAIVVPDSLAMKYCRESGISMQLTFGRYRERAFSYIESLQVDMVFSAGFPFVLPENVLQGDARFVNSHPSLLPAYKGYNAIKDAATAGEKYMGVTVHRMVADVDAGPIIAQEKVLVQGMELSEIYDLLFAVAEPMTITRALEKLLPEL
jgi:phosphoribosylglycinamide formyltransferase 1